MLSVRVTAPPAIAATVRQRLEEDPTVCDLAVAPRAGVDGADVMVFEMTRENANNVMRMLRHSGVAAHGAVVVSEPLVVLSEDASRAEREAPGHPADGVIWAELGARAWDDARPSWSFLIFLLLATLIAGVGRLLDQPILIIGAMVVGPEFAPIAALCFAVVRRRRGIAGWALTTLFGGIAACAVVAWALWRAAYLLGVFTYEQATSGPLTDFIVSPDAWSFVIALLAGVAGVLSLSTSKSSALVGVFISITTVPAVGAIGLTLAVGAWSEAMMAAVQLVVNIAGLIVAGIATLSVQLVVSRRVGWLAARRARRRRRG